MTSVCIHHRDQQCPSVANRKCKHFEKNVKHFMTTTSERASEMRICRQRREKGKREQKTETRIDEKGVRTRLFRMHHNGPFTATSKMLMKIGSRTISSAQVSPTRLNYELICVHSHPVCTHISHLSCMSIRGARASDAGAFPKGGTHGCRFGNHFLKSFFGSSLAIDIDD
jgi:hypothetical protein